MSTMEVLTLWIAIGTWVAGIGTVGAVITSLYLAYNSNKIKLLLQTRIYEAFEEKEQYLVITITNIGNKTANIKNICWEISKLGMKKRYFGNIHLSNSLPVRLLEGEEYTIHINLHNDFSHNWLSDITKLTNGYPLNRFKLVVNTIQDTFKTKIDDSLASEILEERKNIIEREQQN